MFALKRYLYCRPTSLPRAFPSFFEKVLSVTLLGKSKVRSMATGHMTSSSSSAQKSSIADIGRRCKIGLELLNQLLIVPTHESQLGVSRRQCNDQLSRFKLWAGNIGAFQDKHSSSSLEHRIRSAPRISTQILKLLNQMHHDIEEGKRPEVFGSEDADNSLIARSILSSERPNRTVSINYSQTEDHGDPEDSYVEPVSETRSEIHEIFQSIEDRITELFKISVLIRKASPRDRFLKALAHSNEPLDDTYDIAHVKEKYPKLTQNGNQWLCQAMGKAITQRREFLRYASEHKDRLSEETSESLIRPSDVAGGPTSGDYNDQRVTSNIKDEGMTIAAPTEASTLLPLVLEEMNIAEDEQSVTSFATSRGSNDEKVEVVSLATVSEGSTPFECPYCKLIISVRHQKSWK